MHCNCADTHGARRHETRGHRHRHPGPARRRSNSAAPAAPEGFGLPAKAPAGDVSFIDSRINGRFAGWDPDQNIELANGQIWRIADDSRAYANLTDPKVRIERGALGAYYMVITGINRAPRVRRIK